MWWIVVVTSVHLVLLGSVRKVVRLASATQSARWTTFVICLLASVAVDPTHMEEFVINANLVTGK